MEFDYLYYPSSRSSPLLARQLQQQSASSSSSNSSTEGTAAILVIVIIIFILIWSPAFVRRCRFWCDGDERDDDDVRASDGRRITDVYLEQAGVLRRLSELNRHRGGSTVHGRGMSEDDRREYIANVLLPKRVVIEDSLSPIKTATTADALSSPCSSSSNSSNHSVNNMPTKQDPESFYCLSQTHPSNTTKLGQEDDGDDHDEHCCAICLNEYKDGDEICFSNNKYCNHFFHKTCISEWLVKNEECPCCRHFFLFFVENDQELALFEGTATTTNSRPSGVGIASSPSRNIELEDGTVTGTTGNDERSHIELTSSTIQQRPTTTTATTTTAPTSRVVVASGGGSGEDDTAESVLQRGMRLLERFRSDPISTSTAPAPVAPPLSAVQVPVAQDASVHVDPQSSSSSRRRAYEEFEV